MGGFVHDSNALIEAVQLSFDLRSGPAGLRSVLQRSLSSSYQCDIRSGQAVQYGLDKSAEALLILNHASTHFK